MKFKCGYCGVELEIDTEREERVKCAHCDREWLLKDIQSEEYKKLTELRDKKAQRYEKILRDFEDGNSNPLINAIAEVDSDTNLEGFYIEKWFTFIFEALGIAVQKNNKEIIELIKTHAKIFDERYKNQKRGNSSLYDEIVFINPKILKDHEWKTRLEKAKSDETARDLFLNSLLNCVKERKDPNLIIVIVKVISKYPNKFKFFGEAFLNEILDDEEIAEIFSVQFFEKPKGIAFSKKLKKYVSSVFKDAEVVLKGTLLWDNAEKAQKKMRTKRNISITAGFMVALAIIMSVIFYINSPDYQTIHLNGSGIVNIVYSKSPDFSAYTITYEKNMGDEIYTVQVTPDMLSDYDKEKLGTQTVKITFNKIFTKKDFYVNVHISALKLEKTTVEISENMLVWDRIEYADEYHIYLSENFIAAGDVVYAKTTDCFFDLSAVDMGTTFYASVVAVSNSAKYEKSEKSDNVIVKKLANPSGITYNKETGTLVWDSIDGADHYTVFINGETISNIKSNSCKLSLVLGDNEVSVSAISADPNVIMSVSETKKMYKLSPIENLVYFDGKLTWNAESAASRYNIYLDGNLFKSGYSGKVLDVSDWEKGLHTIRIEAAADTLAKVDSEPYECKIHIGTHFKIESGVLDWSSLNGTSYDIYVDGVKIASELIDSNIEISSLGLTVGEHKLYVVIKDNNSISETITLKRLETPVLSLQNQTLKVTGLTSNYEFKINGVTFEGNYTAITEKLLSAGNYTITVVNKANNGYEINSDAASIVVKKLATPGISVVNGKLYVGNSSSVLWYVDGVSTQNISSITAGEHKIYAVAVANSENELNSEKSEEIIVTKLPTPILTYIKTPTREITCDFNIPNVNVNDGKGKIVYYKDGVEWNKDWNSLAGTNEITAMYVAIGKNVISSELSVAVSVVTTNIKVAVSTSGNNQITAKLTGAEGSLYYQFEVKWYNGEEELGTTTYDKTAFAGSTANKAIATNRAGQAATKIEITVKIYASDGSEADFIKTEWNRQ